MKNDSGKWCRYGEAKGPEAADRQRCVWELLTKVEIDAWLLSLNQASTLVALVTRKR